MNVTVEFNATSSPYQIAFEGIVGGNLLSDIAIDDIMFTMGSCSLPVISTQPTSSEYSLLIGRTIETTTPITTPITTPSITEPGSVYYVRNETFDLTGYNPFKSLNVTNKDDIGKNLAEANFREIRYKDYGFVSVSCEKISDPGYVYFCTSILTIEYKESKRRRSASIPFQDENQSAALSHILNELLEGVV
ncbi:hypothetical protein EB796_004168 [Bugula neritina]|uniref:MAM domain-containing protein n=1 Tax=Bugula neritina TaxID=10212 RepID=A0A7J7KHY4_BUGNE|nr:hypothetical protein EB796_004168 [Bugula neritina]